MGPKKPVCLPLRVLCQENTLEDHYDMELTLISTNFVIVDHRILVLNGLGPSFIFGDITMLLPRRIPLKKVRTGLPQ